MLYRSYILPCFTPYLVKFDCRRQPRARRAEFPFECIRCSLRLYTVLTYELTYASCDGTIAEKLMLSAMDNRQVVIPIEMLLGMPESLREQCTGIVFPGAFCGCACY